MQLPVRFRISRLVTLFVYEKKHGERLTKPVMRPEYGTMGINGIRFKALCVTESALYLPCMILFSVIINI